MGVSVVIAAAGMVIVAPLEPLTVPPLALTQVTVALDAQTGVTTGVTAMPGIELPPPPPQAESISTQAASSNLG
jgi:hypothetical protein